MNFDVIYINPMYKEFTAGTDINEVISKLSEVVADATGYVPAKLADLAAHLVIQLLKRWRKKRVALFGWVRMFLKS